MQRIFMLGGALIVGTLLGALGWLVFVPASPSVLVLNGYEYSIPNEEGDAEIARSISLRAKQLEIEEFSIQSSDHIFSLEAYSIGLGVDQKQALEKARKGIASTHLAFRESPRLWIWRRFSRHAESYSLELDTQLDEELALNWLQTLALYVDREPVDARLLISEHKILASQEGRRLSLPTTMIRLRSVKLQRGLVVKAVIERIPPRITEEQLAPVDVTRVLASYETGYRGHAGARAVNIRTAGRLLNGAIILPGEVLSFNQHVGRRVHGRGFVDAPVIVNDEMEMDVGGGVCQVATTLHAAAVYGNLEIVRRRSHSRPSGYAPLGLDATVVDGKVDLRLRNPFDEPILVYVSFPGPFKIRVELLGRDPDAKVEHAYTVTHREPFSRRIWHREEMPTGEVKKKQKGSPGLDVVSVLRIRHNDGREFRRTYRSKYYPVPEVFWMGHGTAPHSLPAMPEGAVALVVDGEELVATTEESEPRPEKEVPSLGSVDSSQGAAL